MPSLNLWDNTDVNPPGTSTTSVAFGLLDFDNDDHDDDDDVIEQRRELIYSYDSLM